MIVLPEKVLVEDLHGTTVRSPSETRPLSLKNTDNKIITSVTNASLNPRIAKHAHRSQAGFIPGRNVVANVLHADTIARIAILEGVVLLACLTS